MVAAGMSLDGLRVLMDRHLDLFSILLFAGLLLASQVGASVGRMTRRRRMPSSAEETAVGFVTGGMLGLFAFLLGIALSMASTRLEARRDSVLHESNAIGTVWLRADAVGGTEGAEIKDLLRAYTAVRIAAVRSGDGAERARLNAETGSLERAIWAPVRAIAAGAPTPVNALLVSAVNEMFDLALTNRRNFESRVPAYVVRLLLVVSLLSVGAMGYNFGPIGGHQSVITALLLLVWTAAIALIVDIDNPGSGQVTIDPAPLAWTM